jgi:8-oxo-dGTP pyrophosphatase MutT (NUDIX family)
VANDPRAAGIVLYRRAPGGPRFLLLKTSKGGHWSPPKGHLEAGETDREAALRETHEEAGLAPRALDPRFAREIVYDLTKRGRRVRKSVVYFLGEAEEGEVLLSSEHVAFRWAPVDEAMALIAFDNLRDVIDEAARAI